MNNQEAKFILGAYRPDGGDAGDPVFQDALAQARRDPELREWMERQRKLDTVVTGKLRDIAPPAELRAAILAGGRVSQRPLRSWWLGRAGWLGAAAAIVILASISFLAFGAREPSLAKLANFALVDLAQAHDEHVGYPPGLTALQTQLSANDRSLAAGLADIDLDDLRRKKCRAVRVAGREVFEICFQRDGTWYHLFAARREDFAPGTGSAQITSRDEYAAAAWADSKHAYALVAVGMEAVRRVI
jgi:hypothetical protein